MTQLVKQDEATSLIQAIEKAALDPNVDVAKMEKLLDMQERIFNKNAEIAFNSAMADVQKELPKIKRNASNSQTNSKYATLESIHKQLVPLATGHGFSMSFGTGKADYEGWMRVTCKLSHKAGHSVNHHADIPIDDVGIKGNANKSKVHGVGSAFTYGQRYLTCLMFNITYTNDDDGNSAGVQLVNDDQAANINALIDEVKADKPNMLKWLKVESIEQIPASRYSEVIKRLEAKRK